MWGPNSYILGVVRFTIVNHGTMMEVCDFEPLISRAANVAGFLTGRVFSGDLREYLEFVSADEIRQEATFRLKK